MEDALTSRNEGAGAGDPTVELLQRQVRRIHDARQQKVIHSRRGQTASAVNGRPNAVFAQPLREFRQIHTARIAEVAAFASGERLQDSLVLAELAAERLAIPREPVAMGVQLKLGLFRPFTKLGGV